MTNPIQLQSIYQLIPKIMSEVGSIGKSGFNSFDQYKFRAIDDIYNALQPVMAKYGVFIVPQVLESHETSMQAASGKSQIRIRVRVNYKICAPDGSFVESIFAGEGIDRSDKATNKAVQASFKYMVSQLFCLAFENMDDADKESPEFQSNNSKNNGMNNLQKNENASLRENDKMKSQALVPSKKQSGEKPVINHAVINEMPSIDEYKTNFSFGNFKRGLSFSDLGQNQTKRLQTGIMQYCLKLDSESREVPEQLKVFIDLSKKYLERFT